MPTVRQSALSAIMKIEREGGYSNIVVDNILKELEARDRAFATALIYGVVERRITLDHIIKSYSKSPPHKLNPTVAAIIRLSLYQLLYMDSVPESAAVNEGVTLAKKNKVSFASGFVNGLLRNFIRDDMKIPPVKGGVKEQISVECSCPLWLVDKLYNYHGEEKVREILSASLGAPPNYIRVNTTLTSTEKLAEKLQNEGATVETTEIKDCLKIKSSDITQLKSFKEGLFHAQDVSSQICSDMAVSEGAKRVLDVCAAPGGKSFTMAEIMAGKGEIYACDLHENRVKLIDDGAKRLKLENIKAVKWDASLYNEKFMLFDSVLCDVPCSGFGIIRRKPEIRYKKQEDLINLPNIQYDILENSSKYVKVDGVLIYSTCTLLRVENEDVVNKFLDKHKEFAPFDEENPHTTYLPTKNGGDGFFIFKLRRIK